MKSRIHIQILHGLCSGLSVFCRLSFGSRVLMQQLDICTENWQISTIKKTCDDILRPEMACSDFGMRGMSCMEEAERCSVAWLLSFDKTSTIPAIDYLDKYYFNDCSVSHIGLVRFLPNMRSWLQIMLWTETKLHL